MVKIEVSKTEAIQSPVEKARASELHDELTKKQEAQQEQSHRSIEKDQSQRKHEAEQQVAELAKSKEEYGDEPVTEARNYDLARGRADKEYGFKATMHTVRKDMSLPEKQFSKFIHRPIVEKASEVAGKTVARPSGIAGAAIASFIGLLMVYGVAKYAGFTLSGSEMPILLTIGFALGLVGEWLLKSFRSIISTKNT